MKRVLLLGLAVLCTVVMIDLTFAQDKEKVGVVDLKQLFDNYGKTKEFDKTLEQKGTEYRAELEKKFSEIKKMQDSLSILSEQEKEKKQTEIDSKMLELKQYDTKKQNELKRESDDKLQEVVKDIENIINEFAKSNGYKYVFDKRFLLYSDPSLEVTSQIMELLKPKK